MNQYAEIWRIEGLDIVSKEKNLRMSFPTFDTKESCVNRDWYMKSICNMLNKMEHEMEETK